MMTLPRSVKSLALLALPLAVACSIATSHAGGEDVEPVADTDEAAIINGVRTTGHPAVVAMTITREQPGGGNAYSTCTGTFVQVNPATKVGYVMTAAHCVRGATTVSVLQGSDRADTAKIISYAYLDHTVHPQYSGATTSPYDVAMIRVLGADATTPVVPLLVPDGLRQGQRVTSVGFGRTVRPNVVSDAGANTAKNKIDGSIATLTNTEVGVRYDNNGDICQGDSGGPVLAVVGGKEYAVAVHSYVTGPCVGIGYSVRAATYQAFFQSVIDKPGPEQTCEVCRKTASSGTQVCGEARRACLADAQCNGLRLCLSRCAAQATDAGLAPDAGPADECRKACSVEFPFGAAPYNTQLSFCSCNACESACAGDTACAAVPACGMTLVAAGTTPTADSCNTCMNGGCCAEQEACGKDGLCYRCARTPETPGCATDALYQRLMACKAQHCSGACE